MSTCRAWQSASENGWRVDCLFTSTAGSSPLSASVFMTTDPTYRFASFLLTPARRQLTLDGRPVPLGARALDLLVALVERRGRTVAKDELLDAVWPGLIVEEANLAVQVSALRKVLGPEVIATVPGRGYRFVAPLEGEADAAVPATGAPPPATPRLPVQTQPLIGRDSEREALGALVSEHALALLS